MTTFSEDAPRPPVPGGGGDDECCTSASQSSCVKRHVCVMSNVHPITVDVGSILSPLACQSCITKCCLHTAADSHFHQRGSERGCQPDGCVRVAKQFAENINPCISDDNFKHLLEDSSGVSYFRRFLCGEQSSDVLEFWLACTGFRKVEGGKLRAVALAIYKKFIARSSDRLGISNITKLTIKERLKYSRVEASVYDNAFAEVEALLCRYFYPLFVNSKEYAEYLRANSNNVSPRQVASNGQSSPCPRTTELTEQGNIKQSNISSTEECLLGLKSCGTSHFPVVNEHTWLPTCRNYRNVDEETVADDSDYCTVGRSISPIRAPVTSIQGSQSSGALTDETFSLTDSSLSLDDRDRVYFSKTVCPLCPNCCHGNSRSYVSKQSASQMRFALRGENLSEKDPLQFARLLSDRLNKVFQNQGFDDNPKRHELFRDGASGISLPTVSVNSTTTISKMSAVNSALLVVTAGELEESAQSILERHVSRVFDSPDAQQTPTRSIDCQSVIGLSVNHPSVVGGVDSHDRVASVKGPINEPTLSSVVVNEITPPTVRPACLPSKTVCNLGWTEQKETGASSDYHFPSTVRRYEDFAETVPQHMVCRMPVGGLVPRTQQQQPSCNHTCANDKVMTWMLVNDQIHSTDVRSAYPENDTVVSSLSREIDPNTSWSTGNKSDGLASRTSLPSQLIVQDPMMPLLNPPDPGTQLEEARRRLQLESTKRVPPKSMMCGGTILSPDRDSISISSGTTQPSVVLPRPLPSASHSLLSDENQMPFNRINSAKSKSGERQMSSLPSTPMQPVSALISSSSCLATTVVYFLCDEPIPYSTKVNSQAITLALFKELVAKKGSYRYYFKRACNDFDSGYVYEEVMDEDMTLPLIEGKICAKVIRAF